MKSTTHHKPEIVEDTLGERIMISFGIARARVGDGSDGELPSVVEFHRGQSLLRDAGNVLLLHQIPSEQARKASRADAVAALLLNKSHMKEVVRRACAIVELYNRHDLELFDKDLDTDLVAVSREGVSDNADISELVKTLRKRRVRNT